MNINELLDKANQAGASDVHIIVGMEPIVRINTELIMMRDEGVVTDEAGKKALKQIIDICT